MVDIKITQRPLPLEKASATYSASGPNNSISESSNLPARSHWTGIDRRRRLVERRRLNRKSPIIELRQRKDRRKSSALSIEV